MVKDKKVSNGVDSKSRLPMPLEMDVRKMSTVTTRIIVYRILPRKVTKGGIIVPVDALSNNEAEYPHSGVVMVAGPDIEEDFEYGDFVYYNQFAGRYLKDEETGVEFILIDRGDVLMVKNDFDGYENGVLV
jgi:co-chaperonin GroES (HSP10)